MNINNHTAFTGLYINKKIPYMISDAIKQNADINEKSQNYDVRFTVRENRPFGRQIFGFMSNKGFNPFKKRTMVYTALIGDFDNLRALDMHNVQRAVKEIKDLKVEYGKDYIEEKLKQLV